MGTSLYGRMGTSWYGRMGMRAIDSCYSDHHLQIDSEQTFNKNQTRFQTLKGRYHEK